MDVKALLKSLKPYQREEIAQRAFTTVGYLYLLAGKHRRPSHKLALKLEEVTGGLVTRQELRPDIWSRDEV